MRKLDDFGFPSYRPPRQLQPSAPVQRAPVNIPATVGPIKKAPAAPSPEFKTMANITTTKTATLPKTTAVPSSPALTSTPTLPAFTLPALDGSKFVAAPTPGNTANAQSPAELMAALSAQFQANPSMNPIDTIKQIQDAFAQAQLPSAADTTMGNLDQLLSREGSYITNARRRGLEGANRSGLMNSSIAQGAAERSAIEASQPILGEMMNLNNQREAQNFAAAQNAINSAVGLTQQEREAALQRARDQFTSAVAMTENREGRAFTGQQNQLDRVQGVNNALLAGQLDQRRALLGSQLGREEAILDTKLRQTLQNDAAKQQDWLASNAFSREFNGALSMMPITSAFDLNSRIQQFAMENPEIYTPEVISGMSNFFNRNMLSMLQQYFPDMVGG